MLTKLGMGALALAAVAAPFAAFATAEDPNAAPAVLTEEQVTKGRQLFTDNGCNACHTLADANAAGSVGPSFDGNPNLDKGHVVQVVMNGQGPMPSFSWLGEEDIDLIAAYVVQVKK
jgi:mono/diheme cytochrome c family protein